VGLKKKPAVVSLMTEDCQPAAAADVVVGNSIESAAAVDAVVVAAIAAAGEVAVAAIAVAGDGVAVASCAAVVVEAQGYEADSTSV